MPKSSKKAKPDRVLEPAAAPGTAGDFPSSREELARLCAQGAPDRELCWQLLRCLWDAGDATLTPEQKDVEYDIADTLLADMGRLEGGLGVRILAALEDPDPSRWNAAAAAWKALSADDREYLGRSICGRGHLLDLYADGPHLPMDDLPAGPAGARPARAGEGKGAAV